MLRTRKTTKEQLMSDERDMHPALEQIVSEAREHLDLEQPEKDVKWDCLEASLMKRVEAERQLERFGGSRTVWGAAAGALAVAAAAAVLLGRAPTHHVMDDSTAQIAQPAQEAGGLAGRQGSGDVRVNGQSAVTGHALRVGDSIE